MKLKAWYLHEKNKRKTKSWAIFYSKFCDDFSFVVRPPKVTTILKLIKEFFLTNKLHNSHVIVVFPYHQELAAIKIRIRQLDLLLCCKEIDRA